MYSASAEAITRSMRIRGTERIVVTSSSAAAPWIDPSWSWLERHVVHRVLDRLGRTLYDDMRRMERILENGELAWTIMRPLGLANMEPPTTYATAIDHISGRQTARRDLAAAICDEIQDEAHVRQHVAVAVATTNTSVSLPSTIWREGIRPKITRGR